MGDVLRVALPCTGLGRQRRGFEAFTREVLAALDGVSGLELRVFGGGGDLNPGEYAVWNLPRTSAAAQGVGRMIGRGPYFVEQLTFFAGFVSHLLRWQPHVVYFADLNFGNVCWHWRRLSGQRFRLLYYNGGPTTRPYTRCDLVQQVAPAHFASAVARGERPDRMVVLPHGVSMPSPARADDALIASTRQALAVPSGRRVLLSVGMLGAERKRMDALVDAVAGMGADRPYLVMLGQETAETPELRTRAVSRLGADFWMGSWPRTRMGEAYAAADAFALLSLEEGFGMAYVEALAAGLPCVAHDGPVTRYVMGSQGFLGDTTSAAVTVTLLRRALDEVTTSEVRVARQCWVREHFGWDVLAPRYAEMLRACAVGRRPVWGDS